MERSRHAHQADRDPCDLARDDAYSRSMKGYGTVLLPYGRCVLFAILVGFSHVVWIVCVQVPQRN